jgi:hypothetical protein
MGKSFRILGLSRTAHRIVRTVKTLDELIRLRTQYWQRRYRD